MKHIENKEKRQRRGEKEKTEIRIIQLMNISREKIKTHKRKEIKQKKWRKQTARCRRGGGDNKRTCH